ncbi:hypothetical protein I3842_05G232700 [Carya illinoinensis]|uniref:Secreted protein n=1 Tax=Carya illinoinensis TaxID=32201 RepID=A0A922F6Q8_CARIL|nr:hypothetical protein I3842_05G232700 [Carya illinoinensis]
MAHSRLSPLIVFRFSLSHLLDASPVMKLMNSDTHSCTISLASFKIFTFAGRAFFMIYFNFFEIVGDLHLERKQRLWVEPCTDF